MAPDVDGESVSSCLVRRDLGATGIARVKLPRGGNQKLVLEALHRPLNDGAEPKLLVGAYRLV